MKNVLVPFDFSNESNAALRVASVLASKLGAKITLLNVYEAPEETTDIYSFSDESLKNYKRILDEVKEKHEGALQEVIEKSTFLNCEIEPLARRGFVHKEIIESVEEHPVDLVVMGTKGTSTLEEYVIGTNVERIIHAVKCPVLIVPKVQEEFNMNDVIFASDFGQNDIPEFNFFKNIVDGFDSRVHMLRVNTPSNFKRSREMKESMTSFAHHWNLNKTTSNIYSDFSIEEGMMEFAQSVEANMICIHRRQHRSLFSFLNTRFSDEIVKHATSKPILILT